MLINGLTFSGYRSFPSDRPAVLFPLLKVNLIAGQNNTGKSNVLRVIADTFGEVKGKKEWNKLDRPLADAQHVFAINQLHSVEDILTWEQVREQSPEVLDKLREFLRLPGITAAGSDAVNLGLTGKGDFNRAALQRVAQDIGLTPEARWLSDAILDGRSEDPGFNAFQLLGWIAHQRPLPPKAFTIAGVRTISDDSSEEFDLNGRSIKRRLLELQNPATDHLKDKELFHQVQKFVRAVLDDETITIDIPHDLSTIHVTQGGHTLPIEYLGTGVHEVVILAAAATVIQDSILCIEEPEVHLHPILQRKLLRYLEASTTNQYFIATHSAHMLDSKIGSIFHVTREDGVSSVRYVGAAHEKAAVCADLGYRPSDLVQTNAVLWVEGPSDRVYLKHWIEKLAPGEFVEGTHYSIMFYGGSMLNSVSPLDAEEVEEFISLRNLNRYMVVLMDSDKKSSGASLGEHKKRVMDGLSDDPSTGMAWITSGYTVENYVPEQVLIDAVNTAHPSTKTRNLAAQSLYANPLAASRLGITSPSKVAVSKAATRIWGDEWPYDLKEKVEQVISIIKTANSHT